MSSFAPDVKNVSGIQFSISSPDEIRKTSVVEITKYETTKFLTSICNTGLSS